MRFLMRKKQETYQFERREVKSNRVCKVFVMSQVIDAVSGSSLSQIPIEVLSLLYKYTSYLRRAHR